MSAKKEIEKLRKEIDQHNYSYYVKDEPTISDYEFDQLLKKLEKLEEENPELVTSDSPTQRVGGEPIDSFATVKHRIPMLSIDNTYNADELRDFDKSISKLLKGDKIEYVVELKIDGVSMSLAYEDGLLTHAVTRGDGKQGDDVTHNVRTIKGIPLRLRMKNPPKLLEVRGEVYMTTDELKRINKIREENGEDLYKNPRNLTSGTLKLKDPRECAERRLSFFAFGIGATDGIEMKKQSEALKTVQEAGLPVNPHVKVCKDIEAVIEYCESWNEKRHDLGYETDGMVVKVNSFAQQETLGAASKYPRWVRAYKFPAGRKTTKLRSIRWSIGGRGELTPVANMDPISLAGTTVEHASLHNMDIVKAKDIRIGDTVWVEKAGEIIPQVVEVVLEDRTGDEEEIKVPEQCPCCGSPTEKGKTGPTFYCVGGVTCSAQLERLLHSYARKKCMNIDTLGEEVAKQLVRSKLVESVTDLYSLTEEQLLTLESFGKKKAQKLLAGIESSKERGLGKVLGSLRINNIGEVTGQDLANHFGDIDSLLAASVDELAQCEGIGPERAESIHAFFHSPGGENIVDALKNAGVKLTEGVTATTAIDGDSEDGEGTAASGTPLAGLTIVVTGKLENYQRDEINDRIRQLGGRASSSVSASTSYVLVGTGNSTRSKLSKAQQLGVPTLTEDEFEALIAGG